MGYLLYGTTQSPGDPVPERGGGEPSEPGEAGPGCGLSLVSAGEIAAVVEPMDHPPPPDAGSLRRYDRLVRHLCRREAGLVPARFGQFFPDESDVRRSLEGCSQTLSRILSAIRGCWQMTLVWAPEGGGPPRTAPPDAGEPRSGTAYLQARRARIQPAAARDLQARCGRSVRLARTSADGGAIYHLVGADRWSDYRRHLQEAARELPDLRATGPWPPYAFTSILDVEGSTS